MSRKSPEQGFYLLYIAAFFLYLKFVLLVLLLHLGLETGRVSCPVIAAGDVYHCSDP